MELDNFHMMSWASGLVHLVITIALLITAIAGYHHTKSKGWLLLLVAYVISILYFVASRVIIILLSRTNGVDVVADFNMLTYWVGLLEALLTAGLTIAGLWMIITDFRRLLS